MPLQNTTKTCSKCGETKPATVEYFARDKSSPNGFQPKCKACTRAYYVANKARVAEYGRARYEANKEQMLTRNRAYRAANKDKLTTYRAANSERRNEQRRAWGEANKEHEKEYRLAYNTANKERRAEIFRAWYYANQEREKQRVLAYNAANKEQRRQYHRIYRDANRERRAAYMRRYNATRKEYFVEYYLANKVARRVLRRRRRATERNAEGTHTKADIEAQYKAQRGKCYYCHAQVGDTYHVDHVIPLSRGGSNGPENLVIACPPCNLSKNDKLPHEWAQGGRLL